MSSASALQRWLERRVFNPPCRAFLRWGVAPRCFVLLETTGHRSGLRRQTPVGGTVDGPTAWLVAEHGTGCAWVRNLLADPRVRVKTGRRWRSGRAVTLPDDDAWARRRAIDASNGLAGQVDGLFFHRMASTPLTVRVDLSEGP